MVLVAFLCGCSNENEKTEASRDKRVSSMSGEVVVTAKLAKTRARKSAPANALSSPSAPDAASTATKELVVTGKVVLPDGSPCSSATVELRQSDPFQITLENGVIVSCSVNRSGVYRLRAPDLPNWNLCATSEGFAAAGVAISASAPASVADTKSRIVRQDLRLSATSYIRGTLVDETSAPLPAILISAAQVTTGGAVVIARAVETSTTKGGSFEFKNVSAGENSLRVADATLVCATTLTTAPADNVRLIASRSGAAASGHVTLLETGDPAVGASVRFTAISGGNSRGAFPQTFTSQASAEGEFYVDHLPAGTYSIDATSTATHGTLKQFGCLTDGERRITLLDHESTGGIELVLYGGHTLHGYVRDEVTSEPIAGAIVKLVRDYGSSPITAESGAKGYYSFKALFPQTAGLAPTIDVEKAGYGLRKITNSASLRLSSDLLSTPTTIEQDIRLPRLIVVHGTVVMSDGKAVPKAHVEEARSDLATGAARQASVDSTNGEFALEVTPNSRIRLHASAPGFGDAFSEVVEIADRPVSGINITMYAAAYASGVVVDPQNVPVSGAAVKAFSFLGYGSWGFRAELQHTMSGADGSFRTRDLPTDGQMSVEASAAGYTAVSKLLSLKPGEEQSGIRLQLKGTHFLAGTVRHPEGEPLPGVDVLVYGGASWITVHAITGANGQYRADGLSDDTMSVHLESDRYGSEYMSDIKMDREDADFVLKGNAKILIGTVIDGTTMQPLTNFEVETAAPVRRDPLVPNRFTVPRTTYLRTVAVKASGYAPCFGSEYHNSEDHVVESTYKLMPGGKVTGRAVRADNHEPVKDLVVLLQLSQYQWDSAPVASTTTGANGDFSFDKQPLGDAKVVLKPNGSRLFVSKQYALTEGEVNHDLGDIIIGDGATLRGRIANQPQNQAYADLGLHFETGDRNVVRDTRTDPDGRYELKELPECQLGLTAEINQQRIQRSIPIVADKVQEYDVNLGSGELHVRVVANQQPVKQVQIMITGPNAYSTYDFINQEKGYATFSGLAAGEYKLSATPQVENTRYDCSTTVKVIGDQPQEITMPCMPQK